MTSVKRTRSYQTYLYFIPAMLILILFTYWPFARTIYRSLFLTDNRGVEKMFLGLRNYKDLLTSPSFQASLWTTFKFVLLVLVVGVGLGFLAAILCSKSFPALTFFSTVYAMPMAIASSGIAMVFNIMLNQQVGALNQILGVNVGWLTDPKWALLTVAAITGWLSSGINFLYFSAALANVDEALYESAAVDGANAWQQFIHITLPSIRNITFFVVVTNIIAAFQSFAQIRILTKGGPGESTNVIIYDVFRNAFENFRYGLASAESVILFMIIGGLTALMFYSQKRSAMNG